MKIATALVFAFLLPLLTAATIVIRGPRQAAGGTCTELVALLGFTGNNEPGTPQPVAQKIKNTAGMTVCSVNFVIKGTGNATCELWSNPDGTGTQYGTASQATALSASYAETVFTWSVNPTVPSSTDFYIVVKGAGIAGNQVNDTDAYENGNSYDGYVNGSLIGAGIDVRFGMSTIQ